jgi:parvulin-like peptidyl-prolyl isomerase
VLFKKDKYAIPSEFRRTPFYKRIPGLLKEKLSGTSQCGAARSNFQPRPSTRARLKVLLREIVRNPLQPSRKNNIGVPEVFQRTPWFKRLPEILRDLRRRPFRSNPEAIPSELRRPFPIRALLGTLSLCVGLALGLFGVYTANVARRTSSEQMAIVADIPITKTQFHHWLELQAGSEVLNEMVNDELVLQFAKLRNLVPDDSAVEERVRSVRANTSFAEQIDARRLSSAELARDCRIQVILEKIYGKGAAVSEQEMLAYYASQCDPKSPASKFYSPQVAHVSELAMITEEEARRAEADLQSGVPFAEVALKYSKDRTAMSGGEAPPIVRGRSVLSKIAPEFEKAIFELKPGEWTRSYRIANGNLWMLVKCNSIVPAKTQSYAQVREECRWQAAALKSGQAGISKLAADFQDFRHKALVQVFWEQYYYDLTGKQKKRSVKSH